MVFVDSSAFVALLDADDPLHRQAVEFWHGGLRARTRFVSTNYVVVECAAAVQRRLGNSAFAAFANRILPATSQEWVTPEDHNAALESVLAADRRRLSWVDCVSFTVMRRLGIDACFTIDRHFGEQGFTVVPEQTG